VRIVYPILYPTSVPAAGVALLRLAVAALVLVLLDVSPVRSTVWIVGAWLCVVALALGVLTRCFALLVAVSSVLLWCRAGDVNAGFVAVGGLASLALALVGGGTFSVDAYLFGRRIIEIDE
jgi:hypothetical protein